MAGYKRRMRGGNQKLYRLRYEVLPMQSPRFASSAGSFSAVGTTRTHFSNEGLIGVRRRFAYPFAREFWKLRSS
jgi:hypothetical protein